MSKVTDITLSESVIETAIQAIEYRIHAGDRDARDGDVHDRKFWEAYRKKMVHAGRKLAWYSTHPFDY